MGSTTRGALPRIAVATLAVVGLLLLGAQPAYAGKVVSGYVGEPSSGGDAGQFLNPIGIAVSQASGHEGQIYVADSGNNRIQRFSPNWTFQRAWGADVIESGPNDNGTDFEICIASDGDVCKQGVAGGNGGALSSPQGVAIDHDTGAVYVKDHGNRRISVYDADGDFLRTFGWDVVSSGPGDSGAEYEICVPAAGDVCKSGLSGAGVGQLASAASPGIALSLPDGDVTTGYVYVADGRNWRAQKFDLDGGNPRVIGAGQFVQHGNRSEPLYVAVDEDETLYAGGKNGDYASVTPLIHRFDADGDPLPGIPFDLGDQSGGSIAMENKLRGLTIVPDTGRLAIVSNPVSNRTDFLEIDRSTHEVVESHGPVRSAEVQYFAYSNSGEELYVTGRPNFFGQSTSAVLILDDVGTPPADAEIVEVDADALEATFYGEVNPNGDLPAGYQFEYSSNGGASWHSVPESMTFAGEGTEAIEVNAHVDGLEPNSSYEVRLVAAKAQLEGTVVTAPLPFSTPAIAPTAETTAVSSFTDTTAALGSRINPNNSDTDYYFRWGTTDSYGNETEVALAGSGFGVVGAVAEISGLQPNTTYHYRVVAQNDAGTVEGQDRSFTTRPSFTGHAERAYEQVSPVEKEDADINRGLTVGGSETSFVTPWPASNGGERKVFISRRPLGPAQWGGSIIPQTYVAKRSPAGWETITAAIPRITAGIGSLINQLSFMSEDFSSAVIWDPISVFDPFDFPGVHHYDLEGGVLTQIEEVHRINDRALGMSADGEHVIFMSREVGGEPGVPGDQDPSAYEWSAATGTRLVGIDTNGTPFPGQTEPVQISDDGESILFRAGSGSAQKLYLRAGGEDTIQISASQRSTPDPAGPSAKVFRDSTANFGPGQEGAVFFTSTEKLTDEATNSTSGSGDLYRYDAQSGELTNISATTLSPQGAQYLGIAGFSEDGETVYYAARGQVLAGEGSQGEPNLYRWRQGSGGGSETRFIATLADQGSCNRVGEGARRDSCTYAFGRGARARASSDGETLLFQSSRPLTGYPNEGHTQAYLYEAEANSGEGQLSCVSCRPDGAPASHPSLVPAGEMMASRPLDSQGRIYFETREALVPADSNEKQDVYEWADGHLKLISTGQSTDHSWFDGASADGDSVFFVTREQLVAQDRDSLTDVYVARVGGGIASQNEVPAPPGNPCEGEECRAASPPAPPAIGPSTQELEGEGNLRPQPDCSAFQRRIRQLLLVSRRNVRVARVLRQKLKQQVRRAPRGKAGSRQAKRLRAQVARAQHKAKANRQRAKRFQRQMRACRSELRARR